MRCIVQKFGGTSVATLDRIKHAAEIIAKSHAEGNAVVAVVSAMAGTTNRFVDYVHSLGAHEGDPEYERVVSSGEMITAGLLAIALKKIGVPAKSYASWQVPIITDDNFGQAAIKNINPEKMQKDIFAGIVPVVCGFQGVTESGDITTLGRGGSDFTAVAVASALSADVCEIYSDVDGVYTIDPNLYAKAVRLHDVNYDEMLEMAAQGAKVLQEQSVAYAKEKKVVVRVVSSFVENPGTIISPSAQPKDICGFAITNKLANLRITYKSETDLSDEFVDILQNRFVRAGVMKSKPGQTVITMDSKKLPLAKVILKNHEKISSLKQEVMPKAISKISIIGSAIDETKIVNALRENKIGVVNYHKNARRLDLIIFAPQLLKAISFLHTTCGLDQ